MATNTTINLAAATRDLVVEQGSSAEFQLQATRAGEPLDLTGYTLHMQVRRNYAATSTLMNLTVANGGLVWVNAGEGRYNIVIKPTDTSGIRFTTEELNAGEIAGVYDLEMQNPAGIVTYKPVKGSFTILREVTRV